MRLRVLLLLLASATAARAQTGAPPADAPPAYALRAERVRADSLGTVTVSASRVALGTHEAPVHAVVVGREALADAAVRSVAEALDARTPVAVRRYGAGGLASVSVRGAGAAQTLVLLDGQPLADPQLGQLDLSLMPSSLLESVEVVGGAASGLFGSGALGGVVGLRSDAGPGVRAAAEAGAWGERRLAARAGGGRGALRGVVAAEASQTEGDYAVPDPTRLGAPLVRRAGWDGRQASVFARLGAEGRAGRVGLSLWAADAERGLGGTAVPQAGSDAGTGAGAVVGARQWDRLARLTATAARPVRWGTVAAALAATRTRLRYASPFPATRPGALDETGRTQTLALDVTATADRLARGWTLTALVAANEGRAWHPSLTGGARDRALGGGVSGIGRIGRLTLFPALRADLYAPSNAARRAALSPQLGANVALSAPLRLRASAGRAFRMPTLNDRFWAPGGNPDLRPERGVTADAGLAWQARGAHAEVTAFAARTTDLIVWTPGSGGVWSPENIARARTRGIDATAGIARIVRSVLLDGGAAVSLLDARDAETGFRLRYSPAWTARLWAGVARGALRVDVGARAVGARPTTASGSQPLPAYLILGGQVRWTRRVGAGLLGLGLALDNLTDARYESVRSYPMPPRNARLRLTLDFP